MSGPVHLVASSHVITVDYLQTTGNVALQLFCTKANETEKVCPTHLRPGGQRRASAVRRALDREIRGTSLPPPKWRHCGGSNGAQVGSGRRL